MQLLHYNIPLREKEGTNRPPVDFYIFTARSDAKKALCPCDRKLFWIRETHSAFLMRSSSAAFG